tara:strand:+ start:3621 stop:4031 length:411 start_codon:yes stop_codon:yes gene_type:complete
MATTKEQKKLLMKTFNDQFKEFMDDVVSLFPKDVDVKSSRTSLGYLIKFNPKALVGIWDTYIVQKYSAEIDAGDLNFFIEKDYEEDMTNMENAKDVLMAIQRLRSPISRMNPDSKLKTVRYLQNLKKICVAYFELG